jgi:hypothetical protein
MKKLETLKKELASVTFEALADIVQNADIDIEALTEKEKLSVLMYRELAKALDTKEHKLLLDCNFSDSKNVQNSILLVDYYRLAVNNSMIQIYVKTDYFDICTSASKANREALAELEEVLHFVTKYDKKTNRAKTTYRNRIAYEELVDIVKQVIAVLEATATNKKQKTEAEA